MESSQQPCEVVTVTTPILQAGKRKQGKWVCRPPTSPRIARVRTRPAGCSIRAAEASGGPGPGLELACEARLLLLPPLPGLGARAQRSSRFSQELLCACLAFVVFSFLPEASKKHFLDSSLPGALLPLLERTLCLLLLPTSSCPQAEWRAVRLQGRRAHRAQGHGLGAVCGLCLAGRLDLIPAPLPLPTPAADRAPGPGDPLHVVLTPWEAGGGSQGQHCHSAMRGPLTGLSVGSLNSWLCPPPSLVQNTALVILATKGPYSLRLLLELVWG